MENKETKVTSAETAAVAASTISRSILGFDVGGLAGLSVDELSGNSTAITMVMHYYRQLTDENVALKNDLNTLRTYVDGYNQKKIYTNVGGVLQFTGSILIGFGVNLLTSNNVAAGVSTFVPGLIAQVIGLVFSLRDPR